MSTKYQVFDCGRLAQYPDCKVDSSWDCATFGSFEEAQEYARKWLGIFRKYVPNRPNYPKDYSGYGDMIEIRSVDA